MHALNRVGATVTMERFIDYVTNVIALERGPTLKPVYGILPETPLDERTAPDLRGYRGHRRVRIGNAAVDQVQHDVYGSVVLAASQMFFDERLPNRGNTALFEMLEPLGMRALSLALTPDAGIWEYPAVPVSIRIPRRCAGARATGSRGLRAGSVDDRAAAWRKSADDLRETFRPCLECRN